MRWKADSFDVTLHPQVGFWTSTCSFRVVTARQFADERYAIEGASRWMVVAMIRSWLAARRLARSLAARPGERAAKGWAE